MPCLSDHIRAQKTHMHGAPSTAAANRIADLGWARRSPLRRSLEVCFECSAAAKEVGSPAPDKVPGACFEACPKNLAASKAAASQQVWAVEQRGFKETKEHLGRQNGRQRGKDIAVAQSRFLKQLCGYHLWKSQQTWGETLRQTTEAFDRECGAKACQ